MPNETHDFDAASGRHATPDDVQRYADGTLDATRDAARDAALVAHVAACDTCRAAVERIRRVAAALALASRPPADLLDQIRTRRLANERVILPDADDGAPHAAGGSWLSGHPPSADLTRHLETS